MLSFYSVLWIFYYRHYLGIGGVVKSMKWNRWTLALFRKRTIYEVNFRTVHLPKHPLPMSIVETIHKRASMLTNELLYNFGNSNFISKLHNANARHYNEGERAEAYYLLFRLFTFLFGSRKKRQIEMHLIFFLLLCSHFVETKYVWEENHRPSMGEEKNESSVQNEKLVFVSLYYCNPAWLANVLCAT